MSSNANIIPIDPKNQGKKTEVEVEKQNEEQTLLKTHELELYDSPVIINGKKILALWTDKRGTVTLEERKSKDDEDFLDEYVNTTAEIFPLKTITTKSFGDDGNDELTQYVELEVKVGLSSSRVTCLLSSLSNLSKKSPDLEGYIKSGAPLNNAFGSKIAQIITQASKENLIKNEIKYEDAGWTYDQKTHVRSGGNFYLGTLPKAIEKRGSFENWRNAINNLLDEIGTVNASIPLAFAAGGYFLGLDGFFSDHSPLFNMNSSDQSSVGKTTLQKIILSFESNPEKMSMGSSSYVGIENNLASKNNGCFCLEELSSFFANKTDGKAISDLMDFCNGGNRDKGKMGGGLAKKLDWNTVLITSSNMSLRSAAEGQDQNLPFLSRLVEIDVNEMPLFGGEKTKIINNIEKNMSAIQENYGFAYDEMINVITEGLKEDVLLNMYKDFKSIIIEELGDLITGTVKRKIDSIALAQMGGLLLELVGVNVHENLNQSLFEIVKKEAEIFSKTKEETKEELRNELIEVFNLMLNFTKIKGNLAKSEDDLNNELHYKQQHTADEHSKYVRETHAILEQQTQMLDVGHPTGLFFIQSSVATKNIVKKQTSKTLDILARRADKLGMLRVQESAKKENRLDSKKAGLGRCYVFDLSE